MKGSVPVGDWEHPPYSHGGAPCSQLEHVCCQGLEKALSTQNKHSHVSQVLNQSPAALVAQWLGSLAGVSPIPFLSTPALLARRLHTRHQPQ